MLRPIVSLRSARDKKPQYASQVDAHAFCLLMTSVEFQSIAGKSS
jgi:hypothetical protein